MDVNLTLALALSFIFCLAWFPALIQLARQRQWVDIPTSRRRHKQPTPVVGGIGIFAAWLVGISVYAWLRPEWLAAEATSLAVVTGAIISFLFIGILDDRRGISPRAKLVTEFLVATAVLWLEPRAHAACVAVIWPAPALAQPLLWAAAAVWLVGAANAVNLIDGIDGFAGGVSSLALTTVVTLHSLSGSANAFMPVVLALCLPGLLSFLFHNWHPAKIFLGDNGSLTLGFLIALGAIVPTSPENAFTAVGSMLLILAYPILDMGLCVFRRFRNGYPIFKADRSHLHHRVQRLGLTVPQTSTLLLLAVAYFQLSALLIHLVHARLAVLVTASSVLGLFSLLYLIRSLEAWQRQNLLHRDLEKDLATEQAELAEFHSYLQIDLRPLLEVGLWEEKARAQALIASLTMLIGQSVRRSDRLVISEQRLHIYLGGGLRAWDNRAIVEARVKGILADFQRTFRLQYSIDGLPLRTVPHKRASASA